MGWRPAGVGERQQVEKLAEQTIVTKPLPQSQLSFMETTAHDRAKANLEQVTGDKTGGGSHIRALSVIPHLPGLQAEATVILSETLC